MIYLGTDHRGFKLKERLKIWLDEEGHDFEDLGAHALDSADDYTTYAARAAAAVGRENSNRGIVLCGSGVGADVTVNKFDGVRGAIGMEPAQVEAGRRDDDMNVLVIAADFTGETEAREMVEKFLSTSYDNLPRHQRRLDDIKKIEEDN